MELSKSYTKISQLFETICNVDYGWAPVGADSCDGAKPLSRDVKLLESILKIIDIRDLDDKTIETYIVYALAKDNIFVLDWLLWTLSLTNSILHSFY